MSKGTGSVSIIGGADGPTSIFIAGKGGKVKLTTRIKHNIWDKSNVKYYILYKVLKCR